MADARLLGIRTVQFLVPGIAHHGPLALLLRGTASEAAMRALWTLSGRRGATVGAQGRRQVLRFAPAIERMKQLEKALLLII